jgi:ABC-2 type transport system permease protein/oleandomycin transport system permease protein
MTATTVTSASGPPAGHVAPVKKSALAWAVSDTMAVANRNLITLRRVPQLLVFSTIQPVIFVLLFVYVFGGAIGPIMGYPYVDYLMPGIFVQTITFGAVNTGVGLADDLSKGFVERFRSLPMARSAVLAGRTVADLIRNVFVVLLMLFVGYLVGFRIHTNIFGLIAGLIVLLLFSFSLAWIFATIGLGASNGESAQAASFPIVAALVFASPAFVSVSSMPSWLQGFANNQPVGATVNAVRALMLGGPFAEDGLRWVVQSIAWSVLLIAIFAPVAVNRYRRAA